MAVAIEHKCAWITAVTRDAYVIGAQALARSLVSADSKLPLLVMVTPAVSEPAVEALAREPNISIVQIQPYKLPDGVCTNYAFERFAEAWNKLRGWGIGEFDKLCWLDADMLVLRNMDEIFDALKADDDVFAASHACICNPGRTSTYPAWWKPENCRYTSLSNTKNSTKTTTRVPTTASTDIGSQIATGSTKKRYFNAGLILFRPLRTELARMEEYMRTTANIASYTFAEQDFLNEFYSSSWIELPHIYNSLKTFAVCHKDIWDLNSIKNIHYILDKPWDVNLVNQPPNHDNPYDTINRMWWLVLLGLNNKDVVAPWIPVSQ